MRPPRHAQGPGRAGLLPAGFAFVGRQGHFEVGGEDFYIDRLFYHVKLRAFVVIELKLPNFKLEHTGQLGFYLSTHKPMGIAEYQLVEALPKDLEANLPSIEQIERELADAGE